MDRRRLSRETSLQKRAAENRRKAEPAVPDITDLMDAMFFGAVQTDNKQAYNVEDEEDGFDDSTTSNSSRMTQEWLEEARRLVASSPSRSDQHSPARPATVSPRFVSQPGRSSASGLDRRDPLSRSARRYVLIFFGRQPAKNLYQRPAPKCSSQKNNSFRWIQLNNSLVGPIARR